MTDGYRGHKVILLLLLILVREHKKMKMEMEDLKNRMRDIINMKVTREIQAVSEEAIKSNSLSRFSSIYYPAVELTTDQQSIH